ncbi:hypothetical protein [Natronosalvus vescus]|uniref:hypothetical protein n=1 Tax=Natronosalvus vescus TaxID=2953881 RepID=UPI002090972E|nr:hypothetical protein [Natronosalvus vescus]
MTQNTDSDVADDSPSSDVSDGNSSVDADEACPEQNPEQPTRSTISDELEVPDHQPDPETASHVLPDEKLVYPDFEFEDGKMADDGGFDLEQSLGREEMQAWLEELSGGLASHDVGVSTPTDAAIFGVGGGDVSMSFEPDENHTGTLEVTFSLKAKLMTYSDDPDERQAGARGGEGFIPLEMLTGEKGPETYRCYNWIRDPVDR